MRSDSFHNRLGIVVFLLGLSTLFVFYRLISLQFNLKAAEVAVQKIKEFDNKIPNKSD